MNIGMWTKPNVFNKLNVDEKSQPRFDQRILVTNPPKELEGRRLCSNIIPSCVYIVRESTGKMKCWHARFDIDGLAQAPHRERIP